MYSVSFQKDNGETFLLGKDNNIVFDIDGLSGLPVDIGTSQGAAQVGESVETQSVNGKTLTVKGYIFNEIQSGKRRLLKYFSAFQSGKLIFGDYYIYVYVQESPTVSPIKNNGTFTMLLFAPYPFFRKTNTYDGEIGAVTPQFSFPFMYGESYEMSESEDVVHFTTTDEYNIDELTANIEPVQFSLPSGYQAIEYIQSTGHEYINTGFVPTSDDGFEVDFISNDDLSNAGYGCIFGARQSSGVLDFQLSSFTPPDQNGLFRWGTSVQYGGGFLPKYTRQKASLFQKTYTAPNGDTSSFTSNYTGEYPIYVFSLNQSGSATQNGSVILYSLKLYRGADLAMYLIPCKRTSDNKLGLYDVVGGEFLPVVNIDSSANPQGGGNVTLPNPTNPLPITGHDEVTSTRTGKNLCSQTGVNNSVVGKAKKGVTYTFSIRNQGSCGYNIKKNSNSGAELASTGGLHPTDAVISVTFTVNEDCDVFLNGYGMDGYTFLQSAYDYQLELGSPATSYEPYQGSTYTTSLGQTVYGGTLDMVTGQLVVDKAIVDLGTLSWGMSGSGNTAFFYANTASLGVASDITASLNYICENYSIVSVSSGGTATGMAFTSASQLRIRDATYSDAASFKTAMNGVQLVYELATPLTYTLTAQQIQTLLGTNNVWASSGKILLRYNNNKQHSFGLKSSQKYANFINGGDVEIPFSVTISADSESTNPTLTNLTTFEELSINGTLNTGDILRIYRTESGVLKANLTSGGIQSDAMSMIDEESDLWYLHIGDNLINISDDEGSANVLVTIEYNEAISGVYEE